MPQCWGEDLIPKGTGGKIKEDKVDEVMTLVFEHKGRSNIMPWIDTLKNVEATHQTFLGAFELSTWNLGASHCSNLWLFRLDPHAC